MLPNIAAIGEAGVAIYRLYLLDRAHHVTGVVEIDCPDDEAAIASASKIEHPYRRELWRLARRVRIFEPVESEE